MDTYEWLTPRQSDVCAICNRVGVVCEQPWCPQSERPRALGMWPAFLWPITVLAAFVAGFWVRH